MPHPNEQDDGHAAFGSSSTSSGNNNGAGGADGGDPEDAWLGKEASSTGGGFQQGGKDGGYQTLLQEDIFALYEEHADRSQIGNGNGNEEDVDMDSSLPTDIPGLKEHMRRLQEADAMTKPMSGSEYIQYTEAKASASFSHQKNRTKRFKEFIGCVLPSLLKGTPFLY